MQIAGGGILNQPLCEIDGLADDCVQTDRAGDRHKKLSRQ